MASGQESGSSTALEGLYAELHGLGLPFSISGELQSYQLTLDSSAWTVRRSKSGISVSLFWPCTRPGEIPSRQSAKSRPNNTKRKSKNKKKNKNPCVMLSLTIRKEQYSIHHGSPNINNRLVIYYH